MDLNPLLEHLREEIYIQPFSEIEFSEYHDTVAATDMKKPYSRFLQAMNSSMRIWEKYLRPNWINKAANIAVRNLIRREDENTEYNCLAPVNKAFHMAVISFADGKDSAEIARHTEKISTYLWQGTKGMTSGGTNGLQLWDTAFTVIAVVEAGLGSSPEFKEMMEKALSFLDITQFQDNLNDPYRQQRKGGWPFSTKDNGYIVSDCSAEGMKAVLLLQEKCKFPKLISQSRLEDCVDTLLTMQNKDGGFGSYEKARGSPAMELLNPAEIFDRIMVEYSYVECSTAVLTSLSLFRKYYPSYRSQEVETTIFLVLKYIRAAQMPDGSWYGSWGICFTYGTFFALESLASVGEQYGNSDQVKKACDFLVEKQMEDGGWGERYEACERQVWVNHEKSQVVNTAWAVLGLMTARYPDKKVVERGLELIRNRQQPNGEWLQEAVEGVFNRTCMIGYPNYKFIFPIQALGRYDTDYLPYMKTLGLDSS
ncbi:Lanosterol synthase (Oxidosqualene--lanosterol cyclase) [Ciborinia camelliae]|nr:Lanosterol synthase (Oxidosqualene--lanosterol cyclase) [Ciborinia camelliae]